MSSVHVLALVFDLHIGHAQSLKDKRAVVRPLVERVSRSWRVSVAEVGHQDLLQRSEIAIAIVSGDVARAESLADEIDRFMYDQLGFEVAERRRWWSSEE